MGICKVSCKLVSFSTTTIENLTSIVSLALRLYVAQIFFKSGLTKIANMDTTVTLFKYEYSVPFIPPEIAAYMGTAAELILPVLLVVGIGARLPALALFVFNIVAVISYPELHKPAFIAGLKDHYLWGMAILYIVMQGHGKLSLDYLCHRKCNEYKY